MKENKRTEEEKSKMQQTKKSKENRQLWVIKGFIILFLLALIAYLVYIVHAQRDAIRTQQKNPLLNLHEDKVMRGPILDRYGNILAETVASTDENGQITYTRSYPKLDLFFHAVGVEKPRKQGIELLANPYLSQSDTGLFEYLLTNLNKNISKGSSVYSTLDLEIQQKAADMLGNRNGAVLLIEANTGKVLSYLSKPAVDANIVEKEYKNILKDSKEQLFNKITQGTYIPGSIFKLVPALALYRKGIAESYRYECKGVDYFNNTLTCYNDEEHGEEDIQKAFSVSCNTFFAKIGTEMGVKSLLQASEALLFNKKLVTRLGTSESKVNLRENDSLQLISETSIGQGETQVAPLQMGLLMMGLANGGLIYEPYTVDYITNSKGKIIKKYVPNIYDQILNETEISFLRQLMKGVVDTGTGQGLNFDDQQVEIFAKTGTAEIDDDRAHSWVVGFAEGKKPEVAFVIIVENGGTSYKSAVPIGREILNVYYQQK